MQKKSQRLVTMRRRHLTGRSFFIALLTGARLYAGSIWVDDPPYNAAGDGLTDDAPAIQAALNAAAVQGGIRGGTVYLGTNRTYLISSTNLVMPPFTSLVGTYQYSSAATNINWQGHTAPKLKISSGRTIQMWGGCAIKGLILYRSGMNAPIVDASQFAGTAITMYRGDTTIENCAILGFNRAVYADPSDGIAKQRVRIYELNIDCVNGIQMFISKDISKFNDIRCYPYLTGTAGTSAKRNGIGIWIGRDVDWMWIFNCYVYGYNKGFLLDGNEDSVHSAVLYGCTAEAPVINGQTLCDHGFENRGNNQANKFYGCQASGYAVGLRNLTNTNRTTMVYEFTADQCGLGIYSSGGNIHVMNSSFTGLSGSSSKGIVLNHTGTRAAIRSNFFCNLNIGIDRISFDQFEEAWNSFTNVNINIK